MAKLKYLTLIPPKGSGGGVKFYHCHLIFRHLVIMAYNEKLSDIIVLEKCEVYSTEKPLLLLLQPKPKSKKGHNSIKGL